MRFESPWYLVGLVLIPLFSVLRHYRLRRDRARLRFSSIAALKEAGASPKTALRFVPGFLRTAAMMLIVLALARPQSYMDIFKSYTEGLDIVLALDVSTSMRAEDLAKGKNRLDVAKEVVDWFLSKRETDRVGMVVFAAVAYTQCPLTLDYGLVRQFLETLETGMIEDGTAIGNALASAVNRLRNSKAKSKLAILLTDGVNNRGEIDPLTAAEMAEDFGVKVYTIGIGSMGTAPYPVQDMFGRTFYQNVPVEIDEELLREISERTNAKYYRATNRTRLEEIFADIEKLEKTKIESYGERRFRELFGWLLAPALLLILLELALSETWLRVLP